MFPLHCKKYIIIYSFKAQVEFMHGRASYEGRTDRLTVNWLQNIKRGRSKSKAAKPATSG